jgi:hypothetical protein
LLRAAYERSESRVFSPIEFDQSADFGAEIPGSLFRISRRFDEYRARMQIADFEPGIERDSLWVLDKFFSAGRLSTSAEELIAFTLALPG